MVVYGSARCESVAGWLGSKEPFGVLIWAPFSVLVRGLNGPEEPLLYGDPECQETVI